MYFGKNAHEKYFKQTLECKAEKLESIPFLFCWGKKWFVCLKCVIKQNAKRKAEKKKAANIDEINDVHEDREREREKMSRIGAHISSLCINFHLNQFSVDMFYIFCRLSYEHFNKYSCHKR